MQTLRAYIRQHTGEIILACSFLLGITLIAIPIWFGWMRDRGITAALGTALLIAPIVAVGIEQWMTKRIARDVFRAAFSYHFPNDFKDEIDRIVSQSVICTRHIMDVKIRNIPNTDSVSVTVTVERDLKNIGAKDVNQPVFMWLDEWGFSGTPSKIIKCMALDMFGKIIHAFDPSQNEFLPNLSFKASTPHVVLSRNQKISVIIEFNVTRRNNDFIYEQFNAPTRNPEIHIIEQPSDLQVVADFGGGKLKPQLTPDRYVLDGVYFPPAPMKVRWFPKTALDNWAPPIGTKYSTD
jgi:hypothetical protein